MNRKLTAACIVSASAIAATPAIADPVVLRPLIDIRTRYETVDQDGFNRDANAVTTRVRAGVEASDGPWSVLVESEALLGEVVDANTFLNGRVAYPVIADPNNVELNRLQLRYAGIKATSITVGRQEIALDDERFVGSSAWRQNEQTYDAVRVQTKIIAKLEVNAIYMWSDRTIYGIDGTGTHPQAVGGNNVFLNASYVTPIGKLVGFGYIVDEDEPLFYTKSSQTYGVRLEGSRPIVAKAKFDYVVSWARQTHNHRNPNRYASSYFDADLKLDLGGPFLGAQYEVLGADKGIALTSFQTPYASLNKFNGWADVFLTTPPDGLRDLAGAAGYKWKVVGPLTGVTAQAVYHRFDSDRLVRRYGDEIDAQVSATFGRTTALLRYARYNADAFAADVRKISLQLAWTFK